MTVLRFATEAGWIEAASCDFIDAADAAKAEGRRSCHFCLAGGSTPAPLYRALAADPRLENALCDLDVHIWLGDERVAPPDSPARNGRMVLEALAGARWPFTFHPWPWTAPEDSAPGYAPGNAPGSAPGSAPGTAPGTAVEGPASAYARELELALGGAPSFDLALLGLGADGHTASLFPDDAYFKACLRGVAPLAGAARAPGEPRDRLSLGVAVLSASRRLRLLARGPEKQAIVSVLETGGAGLPAAALDSPRAAVLYCEA